MHQKWHFSVLLRSKKGFSETFAEQGRAGRYGAVRGAKRRQVGAERQGSPSTPPGFRRYPDRFSALCGASTVNAKKRLQIEVRIIVLKNRI